VRYHGFLLSTPAVGFLIFIELLFTKVSSVYPNEIQQGVFHLDANHTHLENRQQLVEYLESGCKPKPEWGLGTEHEKFGFTIDDMRPLPYEGKRSIRAMLEGLANQ
jgi:glutamate--cysteine ligase